MDRGVELKKARGKIDYAHVLKPFIHKFKSFELSFHAVQSARRTCHGSLVSRPCIIIYVRW